MRSSMLKQCDSLPAKEQDILYLPTTETPGFKLASPRVFQVHVALLDHARRFPAQPNPAYPPDSAVPTSKPNPKPVPAEANGEVAVTSASVTPKPTKPKPTKERRRAKRKPKPRTTSTIPVTPGLESQWTVTGLAHACGCNRNTAGATLSELVALGWIRKSIGRHSGGEYSGFWFRLLVPPSTLTMTAQHLYQSKADEAEVRLRERRERLKESITPDGGADDFASVVASDESPPASILDNPVQEVI